MRAISWTSLNSKSLAVACSFHSTKLPWISSLSHALGFQLKSIRSLLGKGRTGLCAGVIMSSCHLAGTEPSKRSRPVSDLSQHRDGSKHSRVLLTCRLGPKVLTTNEMFGDSRRAWFSTCPTARRVDSFYKI